jgi:hypothetical protein
VAEADWCGEHESEQAVQDAMRIERSKRLYQLLKNSP